MFRSSLLLCVLAICVMGSDLSGADRSPALQLPDTTPPGKPHFDSKGAKVGDQLPNPPMYRLDGKPTSLGQAWAGGTTLLLTSSYTCPKSRATLPSAAELARRVAAHGVRVAIVYVIEAHPAGDPSPYSRIEEVTAENRRDNILCRQPTTLEGRLKLAAEFKRRLKIDIPMFVDAMDNAAWANLGGGPNMGVLVDTDGIVLARQGWFDAKSMENAIAAFASAAPTTQANVTLDDETQRLYATLTQLISEDKAGEIKALLDQDPKLEQRFLKSGTSLLQYAAGSGALEIVKMLIARGADVNFQTTQDATPLHRAAHRGALNVVTYLISHGADVNSKAHGHGITPLQEAVLGTSPEIVDALVKAGAKPDFYTAAATGDLATLRREYLSDMTIISRPDGSGGSALTYAAQKGQIEAIKLLISLGARDYPLGASGWTAGQVAVRNRNIEMTRMLLDAGSNPNLFYSAIDDKSPAELVRLLLDHKADPNVDDELRPLPLAAGYGRVEIMQMLLEAGADINSTATSTNGLMCGLTYHKGDTPLQIAIYNKQPAAAEFLLKHGAKIDARTEHGETALHLAISEMQFVDIDIAQRMVQMLVENHADVNSRDNDGHTPLDDAMSLPGDNGLFEKSDDRRAKYAATSNLLKKHGAVNGKPTDLKTAK